MVFLLLKIYLVYFLWNVKLSFLTELAPKLAAKASVAQSVVQFPAGSLKMYRFKYIPVES